MTTTLPSTTAVSDIAAILRQSHNAHHAYTALPVARRSELLRGLADALDQAAAELVPIADSETSLGSARLNGEIARTTFQLRMFADIVDQGYGLHPIEDAAIGSLPPAGRPHLLKVAVGLGPVAMFSASNFPFAFSVLGGDTASALAAGCAVVVRAHPGHPALSAKTIALAQSVVNAQGLPKHLIQGVFGNGHDLGAALVDHPITAAVAFTGSVRGGIALMKRCNDRPIPIPFYGELGSVNPVVILPAALEGDIAQRANALAASITLGCGQFCTSPGILLVPNGAPGDELVGALVAALKTAATHPMLNSGIAQHYTERVEAMRHHGAQVLLAPDGDRRSFVAQTDIASFLNKPALRDEVFGPACLVIRTDGAAGIAQVLDAIGGSLTVTIWGAETPSDDARIILDHAKRIAGRVLFSGVPTGVAVTRAQQHGGPFPSSTLPSTTSVGWDAMLRFLRPVALQDPPGWVVQHETTGLGLKTS
jgi:acyl-CoA reductase-like NAD-dependent aldehyde dehydrogenase